MSRCKGVFCVVCARIFQNPLARRLKNSNPILPAPFVGRRAGQRQGGGETRRPFPLKAAKVAFCETQIQRGGQCQNGAV